MRYEVFTGATIGALTVGEQVHWVGGTGRRYSGYMCACSCGGTVRVRSEDLAHGKHLFCTKQCPARSPRTLDEWLANTAPSGACLLWRGSSTNGYGRINVAGKVVHAHREVHRLATGDSPPVVMHTCDTPLCINPEHLKSGTPAENTEDMVNKGRHAHGETHYKAKLNARQVQEIRTAAAVGVPKLRLAKAYGISRWNLYLLLQGKTWKELK